MLCRELWKVSPAFKVNELPKSEALWPELIIMDPLLECLLSPVCINKDPDCDSDEEPVDINTLPDFDISLFVVIVV